MGKCCLRASSFIFDQIIIKVAGNHNRHKSLDKFGWLCWGLTSQSTIFQSCRDGAIASWVSNQYFRGVKCLAQGHNTAAVGLEPRTSRSGVRHSTTEPPRSPIGQIWFRAGSDYSLWSYLPLSDEIFLFSNLNISEATWPILIKIMLCVASLGVGGERLYNVLRQTGSKLWHPCQQNTPIDL